ncbi:MAG: hypothetical protein WAM39_22430, partial [Bryobacteraceae bacterium]
MTLNQSSHLFSLILVLNAGAFLASCAPRPVAPPLPANPPPPDQSAYSEPTPPPPPPAPARSRAPMPPATMRSQTTISGTVRSFNYGPGGL